MPNENAYETELTALVARAGFALTPAQIAEYGEAHGYIREMAALIRAPLSPSMSYMAEPAHVFAFPDAFTGEA